MKEQITESTAQLITTLERRLREVEKQFSDAISPARTSVLKRFPVAFILLTTFGVVATFLGMELIITKWTWLYDRPWLVLVVGVGTLIATGSLYKKLG